MKLLRPIHTKDDNYKDNDKDSVLNIKESFSISKNSKVHTTAITITAQRNNIDGITLRMILSS